jgi:hypothetical protein
MTPEEREEDARRRAAGILLARFATLEDERSHRLHAIKTQAVALLAEQPAEAERLARRLLDERERP